MRKVKILSLIAVFATLFSSYGYATNDGEKSNKVDYTKFKCLKTLRGHKESVYTLSYINDCSYIESGSDDRTIKVWDANTGKCLKTSEGREEFNFSSITYSPDSSLYAWRTLEIIDDLDVEIIEIIDRNTNETLKTLYGHSFFVYSLSFSPDGSRIVSGSWDKTIKIWDVNTGNCLKTLEGHSDYVWSVAFSPDGTKIISGSGDKTIKIWDANTGACIKTLKGHSDIVKAVAFSPDGKNIISGSDDKTIKIWGVE